jgi:thymidine kinase
VCVFKNRCFESAFLAHTLSAVRPELEAEDFNVIGIDEGQFFPDIAQFADDMANIGKVVIVAALDGTFLRQPFGSILDLVPKAENGSPIEQLF